MKQDPAGKADVPFQILDLDHVVLRVADIARAIEFYTRVLGCREERRVESIGLVQLRAGKALIDLIPADSERGVGRNMDHFALTIEGFEPEKLIAHFAAHGVKLGEVARRYGAEGYGPSIYLNDPDGNQVELKGPPELGSG
jgi:glyoxylase I family protein